MTSSRPLVWMSLTKKHKQTPWGWAEGPTSSSGPCAHCPAPWSSTGICHWTPELQIRHWHPVLHRWQQVHPKHCDRCEESGEAVENAMNIVIMTGFDGGSVMVWGGISMKGHTDLYRLENGTLTSIRYRDDILGAIVRPYAGAMEV